MLKNIDNIKGGDEGLDFRGRKFQYVEYARGYEGNRGKFIKLSDIEKYIWTNQYNNEELWKTIFSYCDINNLDVSFAPYYFESDIKDFETNRKVVLYAVNFLNIQYDIPLDAFKFKFTNKSIWVEIIPSVMGIRPSYYLNEIFKEITIYLNDIICKNLGIANAFDTNVYSPRQFTRVAGSYLPQSNRYVIELTYYELANYSYSKILNRAKRRKKVIYPPNDDFNESEEAKNLFNKYKQLVYKRNNSYRGFTYTSDLSKERACIASMKKNGVEVGNRNLALFYASIDKRNKGIRKENWESEAYLFMQNFDKYKIDSLSQVRATIKSAYKDKYVFSCRKIRENMPEHCHCENCPYAGSKQGNVLIIHRKQIEALLTSNATAQTYKDLFYFHYYKNTFTTANLNKLKKLTELKKVGIITDGNEINSVYQTGSYIKIPFEFINHLDDFKSEIILYATMLYCSYNGATLNSKMKLQHYANKIGKSLRTIQRHFKELKEKHFVSEDNKIFFIPQTRENNKLVEILDYDYQDVLIAEITTDMANTEKEDVPYVINSNDRKEGKREVYILLPYIGVISYQNKRNLFIDYDYRWNIANYTNKMAVP
jgi:hypothetical protein